MIKNNFIEPARTGWGNCKYVIAPSDLISNVPDPSFNLFENYLMGYVPTDKSGWTPMRVDITGSVDDGQSLKLTRHKGKIGWTYTSNCFNNRATVGTIKKNNTNYWTTANNNPSWYILQEFVPAKYTCYGSFYLAGIAYKPTPVEGKDGWETIQNIDNYGEKGFVVDVNAVDDFFAGNYTTTITVNNNTYSLNLSNWNPEYNRFEIKENDEIVLCFSIRGIVLTVSGHYYDGNQISDNTSPGLLSVGLTQNVGDNVIYSPQITNLWTDQQMASGNTCIQLQYDGRSVSPLNGYYSGDPNGSSEYGKLSGDFYYDGHTYWGTNIRETDLEIPTEFFQWLWSYNNSPSSPPCVYKGIPIKFIGGNRTYAIRSSLPLNLAKTAWYLINKVNLTNSAINGYSYSTPTSIFNSDNSPRYKKRTGTDEDLEPILRPWQKLTGKNSDNNFTKDDIPDSISSPYPLTLWSIKETKDDKFIAGTFPYDEEDAGGGTFYAMIRPVLKYENIGRDENGNINIGNLSLTFEDAVRKSAWQDDYKIVSFNWNDVNSADYSTYVYDESNPELAPNTKEIDLIETYELAPSINQRIPLQDNRIKSGFYKGQLISYYNEARPSFTIKVIVEWQGYPYENPWQGTAKIILSYKNDEGEIVKKPINLDLSQNKQTIIFNIRTVDKEGKLIEYNITEEIDGEDNYWDTTIINQSIKYKQTGSVCKIKNFWVKDPYDSDHPLSVPVQFKTFNYTLENNINAGKYKKYFSSNDNFISYIESQDSFIDWQKSIVDLMNGGVRENEIKIFCADYVWYQPSIGPTYRFFPYMSIIKKDARGNIRWYHFKIKAFTNVSPNPFAYDMDERTVEVNGEIRIISSFLITCPYCPYDIVDRNASYYLGTSTIYYENQSGAVSGLSYSYRNLGHCPENQFYKKGCITPDPYEYEITNPPYDWEDDKDIYYFEPNEDYQKFYAGVPLELPIQSQFTEIRATAIISNTAFSKDSDNNTTLKNFRIYIVDNLCLDTDNIEDGIPYYYEITIDDTQESTLKAELKFNEKSQNFIVPKNDDPYYDPNLGPEQEVYSKHLLSDYDENKKFIIKQNNLITPNKENIINAYENDEDDFTKIYKVLYGGE